MFLNIKFYIFLLFSFTSFATGPLKGLGVVLPGSFRDDGRGKEQLVLNYLIKECMKKDYKTVSVPFGRHLISFGAEDEHDFVTTVPLGANLPYFRSKIYIQYNNGVITKSDLKIQRVQDLIGKRVISFKGAKDVIPEITELHKEFASYAEIPKQELHTKMLLANRVDAVIADSIVFHAHTEQLVRDQEVKMKPLSFHHVLKHTDYTVVFKNKVLRDEFDVCVDKMKATRRAERIKYEFYINELFRSLMN